MELGAFNAYFRGTVQRVSQVDFPEELRKGNVAVAIFVAAIFVSIAIIIGNSLN